MTAGLALVVHLCDYMMKHLFRGPKAQRVVIVVAKFFTKKIRLDVIRFICTKVALVKQIVLGKQ